MMYERYKGSFLGKDGTIWTAVILQESDAAFESVGELDFPDSNPLEIHWQDTSKEDVICGSVATLTVVSPGDRTYEDLYSIDPGNIRLDVYREEALYWSGCLDPEFYEEPYSYAANYDVRLTFSDFGILDRLSYTAGGMITFNDIIIDALSRSKVNYTVLDQSLISTYLESGKKATLDKIKVRSDNFYNEDGVAMSLAAVTKGILQPLALRIVQRMGQIFIYDLNGLYSSADGRMIEWCSDDQMLGVDKVANNAKVTFSVYASDTEDQGIKYEDEYSEEQTNLTSDSLADGEYYSYYPGYKIGIEGGGNADHDYSNIDFTIFISDQGSGLTSKHSQAKYFHILPIYGGDESSGVAMWFYTGGHGSLKTGWPKRKVTPGGMGTQMEWIKTKKIFLPKLRDYDAAGYQLRFSLDLLLDPRYNPFNDASELNEEDNYKKVEAEAVNVLIPVKIQLYDEDGAVIYHFSNQGIYASESPIYGDIGHLKGIWMQGSADYNSCRLHWYDETQLNKGTGILGWKTNRHCSSIPKANLYPSFKKVDAGQYIPYPPEGGYLEVCVYSDIYIYDGQGKSKNDDLLGLMRWGLLKDPRVEIIRNGRLLSVLDAQDVEYSGVINPDAKDEISLDQICGTMESRPYPNARGLIYDAETNMPIRKMKRADRCNQVEQLLIGTLYSQFATRKTVLSGTASLFEPDPPILWYYDQAQEGKRFIITETVEHLRESECEIKAVELSRDEYITDTDYE